MPAGGPSARRAGAEGLVALGLGVALLASYAALAHRLAVGLAEFGYFPFVPDSLPWGPMRGFTWEQALDHGYRLVVLGPALVLFSIAAVRLLPLAWVRRADPSRVALAACVVSLTALALVMLG